MSKTLRVLPVLSLAILALGSGPFDRAEKPAHSASR